MAQGAVSVISEIEARVRAFEKTYVKRPQGFYQQRRDYWRDIEGKDHATAAEMAFADLRAEHSRLGGEVGGYVVGDPWEGRPPVNRRRVVEWAFERLRDEEGSLNPEDAPSRAAWVLLMEARSDQQVRRDLVSMFVGKSTQSEEQRQERMTAVEGELLMAEEAVLAALGEIDG